MPTAIVYVSRGFVAPPKAHDPNVAYDTIYYSTAPATVIYDSDAYGWLWGYEGSDYGSWATFYGMGGNDVLVGFNGDDWFDGGSGDDILISNAGFDYLFGGSGFDQLWGGADGDRLIGGAGPDWIIGGGNATATWPDQLWGGDHDGARDTLIGTIGSRDIYTTSGNSLADPTDFSATDIAWYFTLGEDILEIRDYGFSSSTDFNFDMIISGPGTTYFENWANTGLSGTLVYNGSSSNPVIFLAGVNVTGAQILAAGSFGVLY